LCGGCISLSNAEGFDKKSHPDLFSPSPLLAASTFTVPQTAKSHPPEIISEMTCQRMASNRFSFVAFKATLCFSFAGFYACPLSCSL
jgi:hypothetical protein